jgi:hypothetical protein
LFETLIASLLNAREIHDQQTVDCRVKGISTHVVRARLKIDAEMFISRAGRVVKSVEIARHPVVSGGGVNWTMRALRPRMKC